MTLPFYQRASAPSDPRDCNMAPGGLATKYAIEGAMHRLALFNMGPLSEIRLYKIDQCRKFPEIQAQPPQGRGLEPIYRG
jgi:hypothetical protein